MHVAPRTRRCAATVSPAVRVLCRLHNQRVFSIPYDDGPEILISSDDGLCIASWVQQKWVQARRAAAPPRESADCSRRARLAASLLRDTPAASASSSAAALPQFVLMRTDATQAATAGCAGSDVDVCSLPVTLSQLAQQVRLSQRMKTTPACRDTAAVAMITASSAAAAMLCAHDAAPVDAAGLGDYTQTLCRPRSKALVLLDTTTTVPHDAGALDAARQRVRDGVTAGAFLVHPAGGLLLLCGGAHHLGASLVRFLRWRFRDVCVGATAEQDAAFVFCRGPAWCAATAFSAVDKGDFPGLLPRGVRRERRWNPYTRAHRPRFFVSLRPRFTEAGLTGEALAADLTRRGRAAAEDEAAEDDFFAVTHEMVSTRAFDGAPNN